MQKRRLFVVIRHCHRADVCVAVHNLGLCDTTFNLHGAACAARMAAKQLAHLSKKPQNPPIASKTSHHLWAHHHPEVFASHLTTMISVGRHSVAHSPLQHFLHLTLPSDADVSPREATCHSKPWGQNIEPRTHVTVAVSISPPPSEKKKEPLQVSPHESRTKNSSDFNLRCSLPFALSMWVADLYHPEILTGRHICCDRLQVQNGVPENHRSLLELRAIPHCILIHFCTCVWT